MNDPYDCHGGPGTTEPACGACITCLNRVIERLTAAGDRVIERLGCGCGVDGPCKECCEAERKWDEAKNARP